VIYLVLFLTITQVSRPYKKAEFEIIFGEGVSKLVSLLYYKLLPLTRLACFFSL
jgi:hypothetical protein